MKKFRWFVIGFLRVGALFLIIALLLWNSTRSFLAHAQQTTGTVVELIEVRDKDDGSTTWKPVVRFTARQWPRHHVRGFLQQQARAIRRRSKASRCSISPTIPRGPYQGIQLLVAGHRDSRRNGPGLRRHRRWHFAGDQGRRERSTTSWPMATPSKPRCRGSIATPAWRSTANILARHFAMAGSGDQQAARVPQREPVVRSHAVRHAQQVTVLLDPNIPKRYHMDFHFCRSSKSVSGATSDHGRSCDAVQTKYSGGHC